MDARIETATVPLRVPLRTAHGTVHERELHHLRLETDDGLVGHGEAAPLEPYDGVSSARCRAALDAHVAVLREGAGAPGVLLLDRCRDADPLPQALAAVDMAMWDVAGRREGRPVAALLADAPLSRVPVNATLGAEDRSGAAEQAIAAIAAGHRCLKVKVGVGDDAGRLAAVRAAAGERIALRIDANGAWTPDEAVGALGTLAAVGLELVEEPVHGIAALREVRERVPMRIAMDETVAEPGAIASGAADAVCLKLSRAGGIGALLAQAALVRTTGAEAYLASTLDGPLGIAAALHCAAALQVELPCGLATVPLLAGVEDPFRLHDGSLELPTGPGLGLDGPGV